MKKSPKELCDFIGFAMIHYNKGFLNLFGPPPPLSSFPLAFHHLYIYKKNQAPLDHNQLDQISLSMGWWTQNQGARTKECTGEVELVRNPHKRLWWGWPGQPQYLMEIFKWFVQFINFLLVGITSSLQKNSEIGKTRSSFPQTMRSVHMYVKLASS